MHLRNFLAPNICMTLLLVLTLSADTIPGGNVSGTWYHSNSPYYINGNIMVQSGDTLVIEPGVDAVFLGNYFFQGVGGLVADGTEADSIRFLAQDTALGWLGLDLDGFNRRLSYCAVRNSKESGIDYLATGCTLSVNHCRITDNRATSGGGLKIRGLYSVLKIASSVIARNTAAWDSGGMGGGIFIGYRISLMMDSCLVDSNRAKVTADASEFMARGGGICADVSGGFNLSVTNSSITNNVMDTTYYNGWNATGAAMYLNFWGTDTPMVIANCLIKGNRSNGYVVSTGSCGGIWWYGLANENKLRISRCEFSQNWVNTGPSALQANGPVDVIHCTFADNNNYAIGAFSANAQTSVVNSIFAHNQWSMSHQNGAPPTTACGYSLFMGSCDDMPPGFGVIDRVNRNGDSCDCYYNLFWMDPMFVDTLSGDYHLAAGSPCIDAGDSTLPYDPDMTIADMGCYWFSQIGIEERPIDRYSVKSLFTGATIIRGPLILPKGRDCRVFDITGRSVTPGQMKPGIYFVEIEGVIKQKVVKVQ